MSNFKVTSLSEFVGAVISAHQVLKCHEADVWYRGSCSEAHHLLPGVHWRNISEHFHDSHISEFLTGYVLYENHDALRSGYDLYALMQHYGLPTRLLDWSSAPLTALYFALEKDDPNEQRAVWVMNPIAFNKISVNGEELVYTHGKADSRKYNLDNYLPDPIKEGSGDLPENPVAVIVQPTNRRISSQSGHFTVHGSSKTPVNKYFEQAGSDQCIKITISGADTRRRVLKELRGMGIVEDTIYQDLPSLAARIIRSYGIR